MLQNIPEEALSTKSAPEIFRISLQYQGSLPLSIGFTLSSLIAIREKLIAKRYTSSCFLKRIS
jgi:hypothetical protein